MTTLNKTLLFLVALIILFSFSITGRGQEELPSTIIRPYIFVPNLGFELKGPIEFAGYAYGNPIWKFGNGLSIIVTDPSLRNRMMELEGKRVTLTVTLSN